MIQLSHPYMTTGKTIVLTIQTFVGIGRMMSLLFNMLSSFVTAFLPRSKFPNTLKKKRVHTKFYYYHFAFWGFKKLVEFTFVFIAKN